MENLQWLTAPKKLKQNKPAW